MSHQRTRRTKADMLREVELLWPYDNPANIARRLGYISVENMLRTLNRWPEGKRWASLLSEADTLQRGRNARTELLDEAS